MNKAQVISDKLLCEVSSKAKENVRLRQHFNFHESADDPLQRMLNAIEPGTYIAPHKHLTKVEVFFVVKRSYRCFLFDETGSLVKTIQLAPSKGIHGVEIPKNTWHTLRVCASNSIIYEIKEGPYIPNQDVLFAPWAPEPSDFEAGLDYINNL